MRKNLTILLTTSFLLVSLSGCVLGDRDGHSGHDVHVTFGNIEVKDGKHAGDLETNSGNITVGRNAKVKAVDLINGNIEIGESSEAYSLENVNGNIDVGKNVTITRSIETVNGHINIQQGVHVGANLLASNGDVTIAQKSVVKGDIIFEDSFLSSLDDKAPILTISEGVTIEGKIHLHKYVKIILPDSISRDKVVKHYQDNR